MKDHETPKPINQVQQLHLELIRLTSLNLGDGNAVVDDLLRHRGLWQAVLTDRANLIKLRDMPDGYWNVDTLYIMSSGVDDDALLALAHTWHADTISWIRTDRPYHHSMGGSPARVLYVWYPRPNY